MSSIRSPRPINLPIGSVLLSRRFRRGVAGLTLFACALAGALALVQPVTFHPLPHAAAFAKVQSGPETNPPVFNPTTTVVVTLPVASTAGNLLVAAMASNSWGVGQCWAPATRPQYTAPAGWVRTASETNVGNGLGTEIWYYPNNPGGITSVTFTVICSGAANWSMNGDLSEWSGAAATPLDVSNVGSAACCATTNAVGATSTVAADLAITSFAASAGAAGAVTFTPGAGWNNLGTDSSDVPDTGHVTTDYRILGASGPTSETQTDTATAAWTSSIALFKPKAGSLAVDFTTSSRENGTAQTLPQLSTRGPNNLLVAFVSHDTHGVGETTTLTSLCSGAACPFAWTLKTQANTLHGIAEIWTAPVSATTPNIVVTDTLNDGAQAALITVEAINDNNTGLVMPTVSATGTNNGTTATDTVTLTSSGNNTAVWGVGNDWNYNLTRVPAGGQALVDQYLGGGGDAWWVQQRTAGVAATGTVTTLSDTTADGAGDVWEYASIDILGDGTHVPVSVQHLTRTFPGNDQNVVASPTFATTQPNELVVATVGADGLSTPETLAAPVTFSGPDLTWQLAVRSNGQNGDAEVWWTVVPQPTPNISFTMNETLGGGPALVTVTGILGADPTSPIGATNATSGPNGAQSITLTTTRDDSWMWGAGEDWTASTLRTVGVGTLLAEAPGNLAGSSDAWAQVNQPMAAPAGTVLSLTDTAPTTDVWDYAAVEIKPTTKAQAAIAAPVSSANPTTSGSVTLSDTVTGTVGTPTGTVTFYDGDSTGLPLAPGALTTTLGTSSPLNGAGTGTLVVALAPGPHDIVAVYNGDATYASAVSSYLVEQVYSATATSVLGWGLDDTAMGELGDGGIANACTCRQTPIQVKTIGNIIQVASAFDTGYALDSTGHVWAWGDGTQGELGQGNTASSTTPVEVCAVGQVAPCGGHPLTGIVAITAGEQGGFALASDGTLYNWGMNSAGVLCNNNAVNQNSPVHVTIAGATVVAIAARHHQLFSLTSTGAVYACGINTTSNLGTGVALSAGIYKVPTLLTLLPPALALAPGEDDGFVLLYNNTVMGWGLNQNGNIGDGTIIPRDTPYQMTPANVVAITAGTGYTVVRLSNGTAQSAGDDTVGSLGNGSITAVPQTSFAATVAPAHPFVSIVSGVEHVVAQENDGSIWAWGANAKGEIGNNLLANSGTPLATHGMGNVGTLTVPVGAVLSAGGDGSPAGGTSFVVTQASATIALSSSANPAARGANVTFTATVTGGGAPPTGTVTFYDQTTAISGAVALSGGVATYSTTTLTSGSHGITAVFTSGDGDYGNVTSSSVPQTIYAVTGGTAFGWGDNTAGELGDGGVVSRNYRMPVNAISGITQVSSNDYNSAAVKSDGTVWAWGEGGTGQNGNGVVGQQNNPVQVTGLSTAIAVTVGRDFDAALTTGGAVYVWGDNAVGELGNGTHDASNHATAAVVPGLTNIVAISAGWYHLMALRTDGTVWVWGANTNGALGDGTILERDAPVEVCAPGQSAPCASFLTGVTAIAAGQNMSEALMASGSVYSWGENVNGQLGQGTDDGANHMIPAAVSTVTNATAVSAGRSSAYAVDSSGHVWAWGANFFGELGDSATAVNHTDTPVTMTGMTTAVSVSGGGYSALVVTSSGEVMTTGYNSMGQLGNGDGIDRATLVAVPGLTLPAIGASAGLLNDLAIGTSASFTPTVLVTSAPNPSAQTQTVTYAATVLGPGGTPSGSVVFTDNGSTICGPSVALSGGTATCPQTYPAVSTHAVVATYSGDANYTAAASTDVRWNFEDGSQNNWTVEWCCGGSLANSTAQPNTGTHSLAINIAGGSVGHNSCTGADPLAGADPCNPGIENTFDTVGVVTGTTMTYHLYAPAAAVTAGVQIQPYYDDTAWTEHFATAVTVVSGWNTITYAIPNGVTAVNGWGIEVNDNNHWSGTLYLDDVALSYTQTVLAATTSTAVATSGSPSTYDTAVTFTATVTFSGGAPAPGPQEYVTFKDGATVLGSGFLNGAGIATFTTTIPGLSVGGHTINAVYSGTDGLYPTSTGSVTQTVNAGTLTISAPGALNFPSLTPGSQTPATNLGAVSFTNTLGDGSAWNVQLAATDLYNGGTGKVGAPFSQMTVTVDQTPAPGSGAVGVLSPGAVSQSLSGVDTTPGTTFSSGTVTLATGTAGTAGLWTEANNLLTLVVLGTATPGAYTGTIQYTITG